MPPGLKPLAAIRIRSALPAMFLATLAGAGWILYVDRNLSFFGDEWTVIDRARSNWTGALLASHNGHWILVPRLLYQALFVSIGLRSYIPYLLLMLAAHVAAVILLFLLVRRRAGDAVALGAAAILLVFGRGAEDLAWAFQVGFILPVACGLAALLLLDSQSARLWRLAVASLLLTIGMISSGIGVVMLVTVAAELVCDRSRWARVPVLLLPTIVYAPWYLFIGRHDTGSRLSTVSLLGLPDFVFHGLGSATAAVYGLSDQHANLVLLGTALLLAGAWALRGRVGSRAAGPLLGAIALFALIGLTRGQFGIGQATASRYLYVAAALILLVLADALAELPAHWALLVVVVAVAYFSAGENANQLADFAAARAGYAATQTVELRTFEAFRGDAAVGDAVLDPVYTPVTPRQYFDATAAWGSPVPSAATPDLTTLDPGPVNQALVTLFADGLGLTVPPDPAPSCLLVDRLVLPEGSSVLIVPASGQVARLDVALVGPDTAGAQETVPNAGTLTLGGDRLTSPWRVTVSNGGVCPLSR